MAFKGLIKATSLANRIQQKRDWALICSKILATELEPDWGLPVKKIDQYMESICKKNNLNHLDFFGVG